MGWQNFLALSTWSRFIERSVIVLLIGLAGYLWLHAPSQPIYTPTPGEIMTAPRPASVEKIIEKIRVVEKPGPERIVYLDKPSLAVALKMPELATIPDNVLSVATVEPHTGPTTAIAVLSPKGEGKILLRQEPMKFFQIKREFRLQSRYLFSGRNLAEADLLVNPVRVGPVNILAGVGAELDREDSSLRGRAFIGFEYKF